MTVTIDGSAGDKFTNAAAGTVALTTADSGDAIVVIVQWGAVTARPASSVSSISSANTTGWTKRAALNTGTAGDTLGGAAGITYMEEWWGKAAAPLVAETITVNMAGGHVDAAVIVAFGVHSDVAAYSNSPFAPDISCPSKQVYVNGSTPAAATPGPISTTEASGLAFTACGVITTNSTEVPPTGYTDIVLEKNPGSGVTFWANVDTAYKAFAAPLAGFSATWAPTGPTFEHFVAILDALVDGPGSAPAVRRRPSQVFTNLR